MADDQSAASKDESGQDADKGRSLNFKVTAEFKKEFKGFSVAQRIRITDLLEEGFALPQKKREK